MAGRYNTSDGQQQGGFDGRRINRRRFLALTGTTAGALTIGSNPVTADTEYQEVTDVSGFRCDHPQFTCGREVTAADGMVSTVDPIAGGVAARVLREGGNAVDAAIALQYVLTVTQPHGSGIGGGGFMVIYDAESDSVDVVNSRERASQGATPDMFLDDQGTELDFDRAIQTGESMGVPGTVKGLETARKRYGSKPRQRLITPAIDLARNGFTVDWFLAEQIANNTWKFNDAALDTFSDERGTLYDEGDTMTNLDLAETLEQIKRDGSEAFYEGPIAEDLAAEIQRHARDPDRAVDANDIANYDVTLDEPVRTEWRDVELVGQPLPSSGPTVVAMVLRMLEHLGIDEHALRSPEMYHLIAQATIVAWGDRMEYMGDPEFIDDPTDALLSDEYLQERANLIELGRSVMGDTEGCFGGGNPEQIHDNGQTTHFSVVDQWGNAVSYTSTIEQFMGSGKMVPGRGFMINNELTDFDFAPGGANQPNGWKRPLSSMSPTMVLRDGRPEFTAGSPGGWSIISTTLQTILYRYVYGLDPLEAVTEPNIYTHYCGGIGWDDGVPPEARETTAAWGLEWDESPSTLGNVQVIDIGEDELTGAADPNRSGQAVGLDRVGRDRGRD
ncbi:gamma-glutamyltransferase [Natronorubrum aibiense]|uniref:Gamma-glutamyltransferase n=1 Tax=Natronorubrum aibiense TaxID=348826 RepID=A0A5P9P4N2_9EURY|nr:gamma-glutamyltransferase [Natronorubrum aibiense]QFU82937.1 gamma-glutamyltransferase [Natronorubrum aibiense]